MIELFITMNAAPEQKGLDTPGAFVVVFAAEPHPAKLLHHLCKLQKAVLPEQFIQHRISVTPFHKQPQIHYGPNTATAITKMFCHMRKIVKEKIRVAHTVFRSILPQDRPLDRLFVYVAKVLYI